VLSNSCRFVRPGDVLAVPHSQALTPHIPTRTRTPHNPSPPPPLAGLEGGLDGSYPAAPETPTQDDVQVAGRTVRDQTHDSSSASNSQQHRSRPDGRGTGGLGTAGAGGEAGGVGDRVEAGESLPRRCWLFVVVGVEPAATHPLRVDPLSGATEVAFVVRVTFVLVVPVFGR
jgi:hypothetical protein